MSLEDELFEQRAARVREIEALGYLPFGKRFDFTSTIPEVLREYGEKTAEELVPEIRMQIAGRIQTIRRIVPSAGTTTASTAASKSSSRTASSSRACPACRAR